MTKLSIEIGRQLFPETDHRRPQTRAECVDGPRPCPPSPACQYHLYLDVQPQHRRHQAQLPDIGSRDEGELRPRRRRPRGVRLQELGALTNLTRERVRQLEVKACVAIEGLGPGRPAQPAAWARAPPPDLRPAGGCRRPRAGLYPERLGHRHWRVLAALGSARCRWARSGASCGRREVEIEQASRAPARPAGRGRPGRARRTGAYRASSKRKGGRRMTAFDDLVTWLGERSWANERAPGALGESQRPLMFRIEALNLIGRAVRARLVVETSGAGGGEPQRRWHLSGGLRRRAVPEADEALALEEPRPRASRRRTPRHKPACRCPRG